MNKINNNVSESDFTFALLEDGTLWITAAKLTGNTHFDTSVRFGKMTLGEALGMLEGGEEEN